MNYFKLRTLVIVLILLMFSFLFSYIYTNGNYVRLSTELEMRKQSTVKTFSEHSHHVVTNVNSTSEESKDNFLIVNQNVIDALRNINIPNVNDIPIVDKDVNLNGENQLKQQQYLQQFLQQQQQLNQQINQQEVHSNLVQQQALPLNEHQSTLEDTQQQHTDVSKIQHVSKIDTPSTTRDQHVVNSVPQPIAARACDRLWVKGKSKWFDERFNGAISSIWTRDNIKQSADVNNWWLKLQASKNKDVVGVMESAFRLIPDVDVYKDRSKCRRCAVVGNSGNLRGSKYGAQIDNHDMIIRMNEAPLARFEEDVGYRETHRLMYPESFYSIKPDVHFVLVSFKTLDVEWLVSAMTTGTIDRTWRPVKNLINVNASLVQIFNPALMKQVHEVWNKKQGRYPSTGLLAIMFALHACDEVDVYGYGANKIGNWDHYWQNDGGKSNSAFRKTGVHNSGVETKIYQQLDGEGIIKLHMGNAHR